VLVGASRRKANEVVDSVATPGQYSLWPPKVPKRKPAADSPGSALAQMRWSKTTPDARQEIGRNLADARCGGKTDEERKAIGKQLAEARKKARKAKSKKEEVV
jgi:hypothetical protein